MKTEAEIVMEYRRALRQAGDLEEIAENLKQLINGELAEARQTLQASWRGGSAAAFADKEGQLQRKMSNSAGDLAKIAEAIRQIAKRTYDAEMYALRLAGERKYC